LATATLAAQGNPVLVWFGATVGIMLAGTVGVVIGRWLGDRLPERVILIGSSLLFLVLWLLIPFVFFSISQSKLPGYVLSVTVPLGILTAQLFDRAGRPAGQGGSARAVVVSMRGVLVLGAICLVIAIALGVEIIRPGSISRTIPGARMEPWSPILLPLFATMVIVVALAGYARVTRKTGAAFAAFVVMPLGLVVSSYRGYFSYTEAHSSRDLAARIQTLAPRAEIACLACFPQGLTFYLNRHVTLISEHGAEMTSNYVLYGLAEHPSWPAQIVKLDQCDRWLGTQRSAVVIVSRKLDRGLLDSMTRLHGGQKLDLGDAWHGVLFQASEGR
jgi:hypothetical protein